mgnify:CR=1 FL=1
MATKSQEKKAIQNIAASKDFNRNALLDRRIKAIQDAGTMTPKAQRGLDRLAVRLNEKRK